MKKKRLTRGESFLPDVGINRLKTLHKKETDAKGKGQAAGICLQEGGQIDSRDRKNLRPGILYHT